MWLRNVQGSGRAVSVSAAGLAATVVGVTATGQTTITTPTTILAGSSEDNGVIVDGTTLTLDPPPMDNSSAGGIVPSFLSYRGDVTVTNDGIIFGSISTDTNVALGARPSTLTFVNRGQLFGNVFLQSSPSFGGDDSVTLFAGNNFTQGLTTTQSRFDLAFGDDTLILDGDDAMITDSFFLPFATNVEDFRVQGDSFWVLDGNGFTAEFSETFTIADNTDARYIFGRIVSPDITIGNNASFTATLGTFEGDVTNNGLLGTEQADLPMTITGNLTTNAGGTIQSVVAGNGSAGQINVTGTATINGGTLQIIEAASIFPDSSTITVLTADGGVAGAGAFTSVTNTYTFLDVTDVYPDGNTVQVTLTRNGTGFVAVAESSNQDRVARIIEVFDSAASPLSDAKALSDAFVAIGTPAGQREALDNLSGEGQTAAPRVSTQTLRGYGRGIERRSRVMQVFLAEGADVFPSPTFASTGNVTQDLAVLAALAQAHPGQLREIDAFTPGYWVDVLGGTGDISGDGGADVVYDYFGVLGGFDFAITNEWIAGASVGYTSGSYDVGGLGSDGDTDSLIFGVYSAFVRGPWRFNGSINYAFDEYDTSRNVVVGTLVRNASADFDGETFSIDGTVTYRFDLEDGLKVEPFLTMEYFISEAEDYTETGAGAANLSVGESDFRAFYTTLGGRVFKTFNYDTTALTPEVRAGWQHEWLDHEAGINASFVSAGFDVPIRIVGNDPEDDAALLGVGLTADFNRQFSLRFDYDTRLASDQTDHQFTLAVRVPW